MNLVCQSVSFRDCPAAAGEKLVLDKERQRNFLYNCRDYPQISDALVLNTCYRLEFYFYAKKCLDFSVTLFFIHLLACTAYEKFPASWDWWIINLAATILMIVLGEFLCSRRELMEIPLLQLV